MSNDYENKDVAENAAQTELCASEKEGANNEPVMVFVKYIVPYPVKTDYGMLQYGIAKFPLVGVDIDTENNVFTILSKDKIYVSFPGEPGMATGEYDVLSDCHRYKGLFYSIRNSSEEDEFLLNQAADYYETVVGLSSDLDCLGFSKLIAKTPYDSENFDNTQQYIHFCTMLAERLHDATWKDEFMKAAWKNVATYLSNEVVE